MLSTSESVVELNKKASDVLDHWGVIRYPSVLTFMPVPSHEEFRTMMKVAADRKEKEEKRNARLALQ